MNSKWIMEGVAVAMLALALAMQAGGVAVARATPAEVTGAAAEGLFLDAELPADVRARIPALVEDARRRVSAFYGPLRAKPNLIFCGSMDCFRNYGGVGLGFTSGNYIVICPQGLRAAIIAHELAHAELAARLGGMERVMERIPQWFDEGQAVMISQAEEFSEDEWLLATHDGKDAPPLASLENMRQWRRFTGDRGEGMQHTYGTARREVARWFAKVGHAGFTKLLDALIHGESFQQAYRRIETQPSY